MTLLCLFIGLLNIRSFSCVRAFILSVSPNHISHALFHFICFESFSIHLYLESSTPCFFTFRILQMEFRYAIDLMQYKGQHMNTSLNSYYHNSEDLETQTSPFPFYHLNRWYI